MSDLYDKQHDAEIVRLNDRITKLEASLADSNEALQVMGLKLAHAEEENARLSGEREQLNEQLRKMGADWLATAINGEAEKLPATRIKNLVEQHGSYRKVGELLDVDHAYLHRIAHGEKDNMSDDMLLKLGLRRGTFYAAIGIQSANTVGGPTPVMDAAPAWEMMAIAWLRGKAAGQAQNNERWPDHAKCYPRWTLYVDIAQELANELEREHQKREDTRNAGESDS